MRPDGRRFQRIKDSAIPHRLTSPRRALLAIGAFALVVAACSGSDDASIATTVQDGIGTTTATTNTSTTTALPVEAAPVIELTQTHEIAGFGYSIDYPSRWIARTDETVTAIAETAFEVQQRFSFRRAPYCA